MQISDTTNNRINNPDCGNGKKAIIFLYATILSVKGRQREKNCRGITGLQEIEDTCPEMNASIGPGT